MGNCGGTVLDDENDLTTSTIDDALKADEEKFKKISRLLLLGK